MFSFSPKGSFVHHSTSFNSMGSCHVPNSFIQKRKAFFMNSSTEFESFPCVFRVLYENFKDYRHFLNKIPKPLQKVFLLFRLPLIRYPEKSKSLTIK